MELKKLSNNVKTLALGLMFGFIAGLIYMIGLIGAIMESYIVFGIMTFLAVIAYLISLVCKVIFILQMIKKEK